MSSPVTRTLVLLRHAKAEPFAPGGGDAERPLSDRGRGDAHAMGRWLAAHGLVPECVLCSPALRTRQTWAGALAGLRESDPEVDPPVIHAPRLYLDGAEALLGLVTSVPDSVGVLAVLGHNPTVSIASAVLDPDGGHGNGLRTAGIAVHRVGVPWSACSRGDAPLIDAHTARRGEES